MSPELGADDTRTDELAEAWTVVRGQIVGFVARRVESREVAEDIVHDVLERFHRQVHPESIANVHAWLYRAARNAIVDHYRRRRRHDLLPADLGPADLAPTDSAPNAATRELSNCLRPLVDRLPEKYRTAVTLVDLEGHTHADAATAQAVSVSGMKSRVQRGRSRLREMLTQCCVVTTDARGQIADYDPNPDRCQC